MEYYYYPGEAAITAMAQATTALWFIFLIPSLAILALTIAAKWKLFEKAGEPGWAAIVPFYNAYVMYKISWGNGWFFLLAFIPFAGFVIFIITMVKLSQAFGKDGAWAVGLIFLNTIFLCIMAFSKETRYVGLDGNTAGGFAPGGYQQGDYQQGFQNPYSAPGGQSQAYQQSSAQNPEYYYQQPSSGAAPQAPSQEASPASASSGKFCTNCGAELEGSPKFCHKCGKPQ